MLIGSNSEHVVQGYNCWQAAHFPFPGCELGQPQQLVASQVPPARWHLTLHWPLPEG